VVVKKIKIDVLQVNGSTSWKTPTPPASRCRASGRSMAPSVTPLPLFTPQQCFALPHARPFRAPKLFRLHVLASNVICLDVQFRGVCLLFMYRAIWLYFFIPISASLSLFRFCMMFKLAPQIFDTRLASGGDLLPSPRNLAAA
jgi:hypothetical protein